MISVILGFMAGYLVFGFWLFQEGIRFLLEFPGVGPFLVDRMLYLFFAFLMVMLLFSHVVIGYAGLFRSRETEWWLSLPVSSLSVFSLKMAETTFLASWAFVFLAVPMLAAYGTAVAAPSSFYVAAVALSVPFALVPAGIAMALLLLVCRLPTWVRRALAISAIAVTIAAAWIVARPVAEMDARSADLAPIFDQLMAHSRYSMLPLLPSAWLTRVLLAFVENAPGTVAAELWALVVSAVVAVWIALVIAAAVYPQTYSIVHSRGRPRGAGARGRRWRSWPAQPLGWTRWIARTDRALALKDIRTFFRDASQWGQFAVFFGLLALYLLNLRRVPYDLDSPFWVNTISFLNLGAASMTLATLTTRFVFPQYSLEGRRLWILGMAPINLRRILRQKFALAAASSMAVTIALVVLSCTMLRASLYVYLMSAGTVVCLSLGLSGLAVGLGALYPNFEQDNPSRIVSGFGGTLCLLLSLFYVTIVVALQAIPMHYQVTRHLFTPSAFRRILALTWIAVLAMTAGCIAVPMLLAARSVDRAEIPQGR